MKRFRRNWLSWGLLALSGPAAAGEGDWRPARAEAGGFLTPAGAASGEVVWQPVTGRVTDLRTTTGDPIAPHHMPDEPFAARRGWPRGGVVGPKLGPRIGTVPVLGHAPGSIPVPTDTPPSDPVPSEPPPLLTPPRPLAPSVPTAPAELRPNGRLPVPGDELPVAPPEFLVPPGSVAPGKHGTFGSPPLTLSRDYPSLRELCGQALGWPERRAGASALAGRGFVQAEYLLWWMTPLDVPVLGTTNLLGGFGFLGEPGTVSLIGPGEFIGPDRSGLRVRAGLWLGGPGGLTLDGSFFFLGERSAEVVANSDQIPIITRPVFSPNPRPGGGIIGETGQAVTVPGILTGSLAVRAESILWGFDANVRKCWFQACGVRANGFVGFRNVNLVESLTATENIHVVGPGGSRVALPDPVGTRVFVEDRFATANHFYGGQVGATYERRWERLTWDLRASVALGVTRQELDITGVQLRQRPGMLPMTFSGGLLAAGPNLGSFARSEFSVVPEVTVNAGVWLAPAVKVYTGFNFLYWTNVIRPGDQVDRVVDLAFVPNAPGVPFSGQFRPRPLFRQSDLWVTGMQFGVEFRW